MDVNQTRFHLVVGRDQWLGTLETSLPSLVVPANLEWDDDLSVLQLQREPFLFPQSDTERPPTLEHRRGTARDAFGTFYSIEASGAGIVEQIQSKAAPKRVWPSDSCSSDDGGNNGAFVPAETAAKPIVSLRGIAVTEDQYLLVGSEQPGGILVFDLSSGGPPWTYVWPSTVLFTPFDICAGTSGAVILDRDHKRLWMLDRQLRVRPFQGAISITDNQPVFEPATPLQESPPRDESTEISLAFSLAIPAEIDPIAVDLLPDGSILVLDANPSAGDMSIHRWVEGVYRGRTSLPRPGTAALRAHDILISGADPSMLYVVDASGNQAYSYRVVLTAGGLRLELEPSYLPMRQYGGKGLSRAAATVFYDGASGNMSPLAMQPRPRYKVSGSVSLPWPLDQEIAAFDGKEPGCIWHRIFLDASIPPECQVNVQSRAADQLEDLELRSWQQEPAPVRRRDGTELPFYAIPIGSGQSRDGTFETLFQQAKGRYLQLRITLSGSGRNTPKLYAARVYYPRFSYLERYLPAAWREDSAAASFADRYLANIEGFLTALEGRVEAVEGYFDPKAIPAPFLEWLASWIGTSLDASWSEQTKRLFLANAIQLFVQRGTKNGLLRFLRLALEACPDRSLFSANPENYSRFPVRIVERSQLRRGAGVVFGDTDGTEGPGASIALSTWSPDRGADALHASWRVFLTGSYKSIADLNAAWSTGFTGFDDAGIRLDATQPGNRRKASDWRRFLQTRIGFTYATVTNTDRSLYERFLRSRYRTPQEINIAYGLTEPWALTSLEEIGSKIWDGRIRQSFPQAGVELEDWIRFVSILVPTHRNAHRFIVLVPVTLNDLPSDQVRKRELARRVAELEKPAHTAFEVKLYWAMCRTGDARVGMETVVGQGSRSVAMVLGREYLATGHLAWTESWSARGRWVIGRDTVEQDHTQESGKQP
ncbi:MAG: phage tail protein [Bryobacteraceae bacterium]